MTDPHVIAIDPGLTATGCAHLHGRRLVDAVVVRPTRDGSLYERMTEIVRDVADWASGQVSRDALIDAVAIEFPQTSAPRGARRSAAHLPSYGLVVGAITQAVRSWNWEASMNTRLLTPSATEWTRGYPRNDGDRQKLARVRLVERMFSVTLTGSRGGVLSDAADAVLLGDWAVGQVAGLRAKQARVTSQYLRGIS